VPNRWTAPGAGWSPHCLRDGRFAPETIRRRLGHANAQTVLRYADQHDTTTDAQIRAWRRQRSPGAQPVDLPRIRTVSKVKKAREELEAVRRQQQEMVERLVGNYRAVLERIDPDGPATAQEQAALEQARAAVKRFGGFEAQYEQIERVSAHHGDNWEVLLHGHLKADRPVMFDLAGVIELTATSEDASVLHALAHAKAHRAPTRDYIPDVACSDCGDGHLITGPSELGDHLPPPALDWLRAQSWQLHPRPRCPDHQRQQTASIKSP